MNNKNEYMCPICGEDSLCTDFTDGFKWGRAYCNSCDCGGPEVRTGYEESLDAPWREEARKQFVDVVNEHVSKRCLEWVETTERLPETERWVLGATRDEVREMRYRRNYLQSFWDNGDGHFPKPTYWCELPEPPKEETK